MRARTTGRTEVPATPATTATAEPGLTAALARAAGDGSYTSPAALAALDAYVARHPGLTPARLATGVRRSLALAVPGHTTAAAFEVLARELVRHALRGAPYGGAPHAREQACQQARQQPRSQ